MSRPSIVPGRANLSLTEELEKLEQSITLTLQEIDSNFARAHRIVTSSILPVVDQYAKHSEAVWNGSKFWKDFFERSGNVSFNNYAEPAIENCIQEELADSQVDQSESIAEQDLFTSPAEHVIGQMTDSVSDLTTKTFHSDDDEGEGDSESDDYDDDPVMSSPSMAAHNHSTPRISSSSRRSRLANQPNASSSYETIQRQIQSYQPKHIDQTTSVRSRSRHAGPATPGHRPPALPDMTMTPVESSPFAMHATSALKSTNKDPVLHQAMLGRTYRIGATPMTTRKTQWIDPVLSSPIGEEPQLRPEIFSSPANTTTSTAVAPPKPGLSVVSPRKKKTIEKHRQDRRCSLQNLTGRPSVHKSAQTDLIPAGHSANHHFIQAQEPPPLATDFTLRSRLAWNSDEEDDEMPVFSPPKTLRFEFGQAHIIQTPAREASRRIVQDLFYNATPGHGIRAAAPADSGRLSDEYSPSIIKSTNYQDDTF